LVVEARVVGSVVVDDVEVVVVTFVVVEVVVEVVVVELDVVVDVVGGDVVEVEVEVVDVEELLDVVGVVVVVEVVDVVVEVVVVIAALVVVVVALVVVALVVVALVVVVSGSVEVVERVVVVVSRVRGANVLTRLVGDETPVPDDTVPPPFGNPFRPTNGETVVSGSRTALVAAAVSRTRLGTVVATDVDLVSATGGLVLRRIEVSVTDSAVLEVGRGFAAVIIGDPACFEERLFGSLLEIDLPGKEVLSARDVVGRRLRGSCERETGIRMDRGDLVVVGWESRTSGLFMTVLPRTSTKTLIVGTIGPVGPGARSNSTLSPTDSG
jgi:hypothetical protein